MLTGKQKRYLRGLGHDLKPVVQVGKNELSESLLTEMAGSLAKHELIKVRILESCELDRHEVAEKLARAAAAECVHVLGRTLLFYRQAEKPVIELPTGSR